MTRFRARARRAAAAIVAAGMLAATGCSLQDLVGSDLPPTSIDPDLFETEEGALALYRGTLRAFRRGFGGSSSYVLVSARMTDELTTGAYTASGAPLTLDRNTLAEVDSRTMPEDQLLRSSYVESWYRDLNMARNQAVDAIYYLSKYTVNVPRDLVGHMYAIRGMTMIYLADAFCSGIPLTDYRPGGGIVYQPGSTTEEVYTRAIAQFDTALTHMPDSIRYRYLAKVGKARALLNLGQHTAAAVEVADVPTSFKYEALYAEDYEGSFNNNLMYNVRDWMDPENSFGTVADREGGNGLPFVSANDPRVPVVPAPLQSSLYPETTYMLPARLLPNRPPWNGLGTKPGKNGENIVVGERDRGAADRGRGRGGVREPGVPHDPERAADHVHGRGDLSDPGSGRHRRRGRPAAAGGPGHDRGAAAAPHLRRAWILAVHDGQRQGDLRRMVRVYGFPQDQVYPSGYYVLGGSYGPYTILPIPFTEQQINPKYTGGASTVTRDESLPCELKMTNMNPAGLMGRLGLVLALGRPRRVHSAGTHHVSPCSFQGLIPWRGELSSTGP